MERQEPKFLVITMGLMVNDNLIFGNVCCKVLLFAVFWYAGSEWSRQNYHFQDDDWRP